MTLPKIITTSKTYDWPTFRADLAAGMTVAMVALPLSIAIAIASGARPMDGLVTAIVAGFFISALGGSRVQIGGPTGAFIVVVYGVIADYGYDGLVLATFMAGLILMVAGYLRIGNLVRYVPEAVVSGFTIGIALIIATSQLKDALGLRPEDLPADFLEKVPVLWAARDSFSLAAFGLAAGSIVAITLVRRMSPRIPGPIIVVAGASALALGLDLQVDTIASRYGELRSSLPPPALPEISLDRVIEMLPSALVIAFLAGVESLLSAMVADRMIGSQHRPNAEVVAQGVANLASALFGGMPATGAIARTATNVRAGGKTPVAGIVHAVVLLICLLVAGPLAGKLAMPALAGLLLLTAWNMSEPQHWRDHLRLRPADRLLFFATLILTVLVDLTVAIGVGVGLGLALRLRRRKVPTDWHMPER